VLLLALGLAFVLRAWGLAYGLPHVYNPDEVAILSRALSLADRGLNPGNFVYPSLYFYLLAALTGAVYIGQWLTGAAASLDAFQRAFWTDPSSIYLAARALSVAAGVATVAMTYVLARAVAGRTAAGAAALLLAVAYVPVRDAHMIKHDVIATLLFTLVVWQSRRVWQRGRLVDYALAGGLAGVTLAFHYYGIVAVVPVAAAAILRAGGLPALARDRGVLVAAGAWALAFAALSPYVLLDAGTAARDIAQNRQIIVDRARETFGLLGAGREQARLMIVQGAGAPMVIAALAGAVMLGRRSWREAVWLFALPAAFALLLTQTWPYGRLQNALYPFVAIAAAIGIQGVTSLVSSISGTAMATSRTFPARLTRQFLLVVCAAIPLWHSVLMNRLMTREDTRTEARRWIEANVPDGAGVAVQPYSVPLETSRDWQLATLGQAGPREPMGSRARGLLARAPYPAPAYRLVILGSGGLDRDKRFLASDAILAAPGVSELRRAGVAYVVLKRMSADEPDPLRDRIAPDGALLYRAWPFDDPAATAPAQLPDHDLRPSRTTRQPGPIVEVWRIAPGGHER
jgi:hypothetical protein